MVAGTIALILSMNPEATVAQLRSAVLQVQGYSTLTGLSVTGGELDANKAVDYAKSHFANFSATVIGDTAGYTANDTFEVRLESGRVRVYVNDLTTAVADVANSASTLPLAIFGLNGNDNVTVAAGVNVPLYVSGGAGNDTLRGGNGDDTLLGAGDNDSLLSSAGDDLLSGGTGTDAADYSAAPSAVTITLDDTTNDADGSGGTDNVASSIERLFGSPYNDALSGSAGADYIDAGLGNDSIYGDAGNDTLIGQRGVDSLNGTDGNDVLYINEAAPGVRDQTVRGGTGTDTLYYDDADASPSPVWDSAVETTHHA